MMGTWIQGMEFMSPQKVSIYRPLATIFNSCEDYINFISIFKIQILLINQFYCFYIHYLTIIYLNFFHSNAFDL